MADSLEILNDKNIDLEIRERIARDIDILKTCNKLMCRTSDLLSDGADNTDIEKFDMEIAGLKNLLR